jgi:iron complex outermembrane recepter protein
MRAGAACVLILALNAPTVAQQTPDAAAQQQVKPVTTTVVVHGEVKNDYLANPKVSATLDGTSIQETPLSVTAISSAVLEDQGARVLSDVVKNDASVGEDYAPVGYYGDYQIRGFPIDLATGLEIDGMSITGEQDVPLENKDRVEILKGVAGLESGIASPGGVFNFVTKEPVSGMRPVIEVATDHRGSAYGAVDVSRVFGGPYSPGVRLNLAGERIATYVEHANGWRGVGAADSDFHFGPATTLNTDFEYQHKVQRSEAGYQLLGGTTIPGPVYPSTMLGFQDWSKPNTFDTFNAGARLRHAFNTKWTARAAGEYSHSLIDDNVIWPYGPALDADGNSLCPDSPYYFFCPDGSYEIYDYRSPGELRVNASGEALLQGTFKTGAITHEVIAGGEIFHRAVDLSPTIVYTPLGVESLFTPNVAYAPESPYQEAGPSTLADFNHQTSAIVQERAKLPGGVALQAGGRYVRVGDFNYASARTEWLPQYAATFSPRGDVTVYGNYGVLLSLGPQAPWWVDNSAAFLDPYSTRQSEVGIKYERTILLTAALFRMRQPFFYPKTIDAPDNTCTADEFYGPGDLCFEAQGHETHSGLELNAQGKTTSWMQLTASVAAIAAKSSETGTASFDGKQVLNVPHVRATLFADALVPHLNGLHVMPGWSYTGRKAATMDDAVSVAGYNLFSLGARYAPGGEGSHVTLRMYADNLLNKRYWKDTGASYGDMFIHQGAPATVRLSAQYTF